MFLLPLGQFEYQWNPSQRRKREHSASEMLQNLTVGDELKTFNYRLGLMDWKNSEFVSFIISLCVTLKPLLYGNIFARKFNDASTSDCIVKCQEKQKWLSSHLVSEW